MSSEIIEKLKNDDEYYGGIGKQFMSNSDIGTLLKNPKDYGKSREDNKAFAMGRYFHQLLLEPEKAANVDYVDVGSRNSKAYKDYLFEVQKDIVLLSSEVLEVQRWVSAMKMNMDFYDCIYSNDTIFEQPAIGELYGCNWKCKADIVAPDVLYDLKTTSDIDNFKWNFRKYNYDSQAYIYSKLLGKPMVFLVIDKSTLMMGRYTVSEESLRYGEMKVKKAVEIRNKFFGENPTQDIGQFYFEEEI